MCHRRFTMSVQDARAFVKRALTDEEFAQQLVKLKTDEARQGFAQDAGYVFTQDDVQQLLPSGVTVEQLRGLEAGDELPDEIMEAIVGGKSELEEFGISLAIEVGAAIVYECAAAAI
jgi:predicted ribosomally synthesized peptide with nif11-like leader